MSDLTATKLRKLYEDAGIAFSDDDSDSARKLDAEVFRQGGVTKQARGIPIGKPVANEPWRTIS